jgi:peptidyl-prolyl cis-trans isomerase A (cyclophilin A)
MPWMTLVVAAGLMPLTLAGQSQTSTPKPAPASTATAPAAKPKPAGASLLHPESLKTKAPDVYEVKFDTTKGEFVLQVTRAWAPLGADRFYNLVKNHFYDGVSFFRVVPGFVVQFGLTGNPAVNKAWNNANIKDDPVVQSNKPGTITFAMAGPNTRTTQVFISFGDNSRLDAMNFAPFGKVTSGMDVVNQLYGGYADAPTGHQDEITNQGKAYLDKNWPKLDSIKTATIISPAPAAASAPAKKAAPAAAKPAASGTDSKPKQ